MLNSFYTSATGAIELQKGFDVTANNVANVSTNGYKTIESSFSDLVYTNVHAPEDTENAVKTGHGTKLQNTNTVFTTGPITQTDGTYDYALTDSNTFFAVQSGDETLYTRNGNFQLSVEDDGNYLVTSDGKYVLDSNGERIVVTGEDDDLDIGVVTFNNCDGLVREEDTCYAASDVSGEAMLADNPGLIRGSLEGSNVDISTEMGSVIELQRAFQMNSKMIQISDELMQTLNSLA